MVANEKRRYVRVRPDDEYPVEVHIMGAGFLDLLTATDISEGGLQIKVPHGFEGCNINAPVELVLKLPKRRSFKAVATIKHIGGLKAQQEGSFGVRFDRMAEEDRASIAAYVDKRVLAGASK